jgi:hypothetical protein
MRATDRVHVAKRPDPGPAQPHRCKIYGGVAGGHLSDDGPNRRELEGENLELDRHSRKSWSDIPRPQGTA